MAGKRGASSDINHDNWDLDDEPEDPGTFQKAPEEVLKKRIIKSARRRNPISAVMDGNSQDDKKSAFTGFNAFGRAPAPSNTAFNFLTDLTKPEQPKVNGTTEQSGGNSTLSSLTKPQISSQMLTTKEDNDKSSKYYGKLKGLNESVSKWIKQHVDSNPIINLQPIFKDYERYFEEIEKDEKNSGSMKVDNVSSNKIDTAAISSFVFKPAETIPDVISEKETKTQRSYKFTELPTKSPPKDIQSIFGSGASTSKPTFNFGSGAASTFSFGGSSGSSKATTTPTLSSQFSFGSSTGSSTGSFSFANVVPNATTQETTTDNQDEDEPPKVEFTPVVEKDYAYTTRCKVFVKKDQVFGDRGVGNLYLKTIADSEKVQLIVRADTNLGNLLCNFILSKNIPMQKLGKKDVMLVCLPTPDAKPPPVPVLLRVKSSEEADKLLETLEKYKK